MIDPFVNKFKNGNGWSSNDALHERWSIQLASLAVALLLFIIIRKGRQCKAGRGRLTPYQSEDLNPTTPTHRMKEEKSKTVGDKK